LTRRSLFGLVAGLLTAAVSPFRHDLCLAEIDDLQTRVMLNDLEIDKSLHILNENVRNAYLDTAEQFWDFCFLR